MDLWSTKNSSGKSVDISPYPDLRDHMHAILFGDLDLIPQGQQVVLREFNDKNCVACWDPVTGGSRRPNCAYCGGEGYQFAERVVTMAVFAGVAPVYKPGMLGTGQYPMSPYGTIDPNRFTGYVEYSVYPNYERYTLQQARTSDKMYQLKVDENGDLAYGTDGQLIRTAKWKVLSVTPIRGDYGRVEYLEVGLLKENT